MKTKEEINHFIGFCEIVEDDFAIRIISLFSHSSKKTLEKFREKLNKSLKEKRSCPLNEFNLLMGEQVQVALNILNWMEE